MSENLHQHNEQWDDLPLPNEEEAWQKMKRLLDKEDKRRRRLLPFWFWRYGLPGLLLLGVATGSYFLLNQGHNEQAVNKPIKGDSQQPEVRTKKTGQKEPGKKKDLLPRDATTGKGALKSSRGKGLKENSVQDNSTTTADKKAVPNNSGLLREKRNNLIEIPLGKKQMNGLSGKKRPLQRKDLAQQKQSPHREALSADNDVAEGPEGDVALRKPQPIASPNNTLQKKADSLKQVSTKAVKDSINAKDSAKIITSPIVSNETKKEKPKKKGHLQFSAGVGMQQTVAFNGQQLSSYDSTRKRIGWFDYIPSVYLRLQKERWFLQAEFHYRVPQLVKPFSYSQTTSYDSVNALLRTERLSLQKLYYHQILFSINRFVLPNWSWGIGGAYNLLAGAVVEQQMEDKNVMTGGETFWRKPFTVKGYKDSFLYKSTAGILLQTDYHWKRLSVGLRYTKNLQPFIKYTKPDGTVSDEKNQVLQAVLRFQVF